MEKRCYHCGKPHTESGNICAPCDVKICQGEISKCIDQIDARDHALRQAREGLLAVAAVVEQRSPAYREVVKALEAVDVALGVKNEK